MLNDLTDPGRTEKVAGMEQAQIALSRGKVWFKSSPLREPDIYIHTLYTYNLSVQVAKKKGSKVLVYLNNDAFTIDHIITILYYSTYLKAKLNVFGGEQLR